jgi:alpha-mannosidase
MPMEFFHAGRLQRLVAELGLLRYRERRPLGAFACHEDDGAIGRSAPDPAARCGSMQVGDRWVGRDRYLWLTRVVDLPDSWLSREVVGLFDFGRTGGGNNQGFEALLFLDGRPFQGVDGNHQEVIFDPRETGPQLHLAFRLWSGLEGGGPPRQQSHELLCADLAWLDPACDDLFFTARAALATAAVLDEHAPEKSLLLNLLNQTFQKVDFSEPVGDTFYGSVVEARDFLVDALAQQRRESPVTVTCVGHTHIDLAWLWQLKHTREKAARSFSTVNRLMARYDDFTFLQSQPQIYEYIKQDYPDIYGQIRDRVKTGRWEAGGAMWVEADCNISSGEALVRQIVYGIRYFEREFEVSNTYLWLPDVFGYSWALPQIMRQCGLSTFITTKISWNEFNKLPHDTFVWRGIDGSEVTAHFVTVPDDGSPDSWYYTYNGLIEPGTVSGAWKNYADKSINQELLLAYGYGDGGGGPNRHMLEMRRRLDAMPGMPRTQSGRVDEYVSRLNSNIRRAHGGYVHVWDGELYLEYHRGTYTSQAYNKRMNRYLELRYRETEFLCALDAIINDDWQRYPQRAIYDGWKIVLRNQFHDIIPGSAIREVYEDSRREYAEADEIAAACEDQAVRNLTQPDSPLDFTVINSASWQRSGLVRLALPGFSGSVQNQRGESLPIQCKEDHVLVRTVDVPSFGAIRLLVVEGETSPLADPFEVTGNCLETPFYRLEWNEQGHISRLFDRHAQREVLAEESVANVLQVFEDKPRQYDAWELEVSFEQKKETIDEFRGTEAPGRGPLQIAIRFAWQYRNSRIDQTMVLYRDDPRIDFRTEIDWQEREKIVKVAFPVRIRSSEATYDIQYGNVRRPTHRNTSWDHAKFEVVGHQWADLSEEGYGVALLNDCKYGYDVRDNVLRLTLLKSSNYPDPQADLGRHRFCYSLLPHTGSWQQAGVARYAWDLNAPLYAVPGEAAEGINGRSLLRCDNPNVMIDVVKKAEDSDDLIVRMHEYAGSRGPVNLCSDLVIVSWQPCNLLEHPIGPKQSGNEIGDTISPYQIRTYRVTVKTAA